MLRSRTWTVVLGFALAMAGLLRAEKVSSLGKPSGYVDDYAGVFSSDERASMEAMCVELHEKIHAQAFVVTVKSLEGDSIEHFANDLFHTWKIGDKKSDKGVLLLFAVKDHRYRIEVGYGLEGILNDAKVGDIGREMVPELKAGNYDAAADGSLRSVLQIISTDANVPLEKLEASPQATSTELAADLSAGELPAPPTPPSDAHPWLIPVIFIGAWVVLVGGLVVVGIRRGIRGGRSSGSAGGSSSFDSDSSSSSSDSGDSFGGGDGGDSGGGGASGSW
ncbi:uncharacterized protein SAMN05421819_0173 [Bryocella elongata]|uniref:TPM domain-containing protein n=1 Tax=Bryocella elongata TaxID=863522 RepID=A0A1H5SH50_9BACT|nr:TPM domain-containing protein [Bryocella elongata]SEF49077.1 uncharacterized protein SAMN05421819_0173 [Bryocella elongata]